MTDVNRLAQRKHTAWLMDAFGIAPCDYLVLCEIAAHVLQHNNTATIPDGKGPSETMHALHKAGLIAIHWNETIHLTGRGAMAVGHNSPVVVPSEGNPRGPLAVLFVR